MKIVEIIVQNNFSYQIFDMKFSGIITRKLKGSFVMIKVSVLENKLVVCFIFNAEIIARIKCISGRKWDAIERNWILPNDRETIRAIKKNIF